MPRSEIRDMALELIKLHDRRKEKRAALNAAEDEASTTEDARRIASNEWHAAQNAASSLRRLAADYPGYFHTPKKRDDLPIPKSDDEIVAEQQRRIDAGIKLDIERAVAEEETKQETLKQKQEHITRRKEERAAAADRNTEK